MGSPIESSSKKKKFFLIFLFISYVLFPIGELLKVSFPYNTLPKSFGEYVNYFENNTFNNSYNSTSYLNINYTENIQKLRNFEENFFLIWYVNVWSCLILPCIDIIMMIFTFCGMAAGLETAAKCCFICFFLGCGDDCIKCMTKAALANPLILQFLCASIIFLTNILLITKYKDAESGLNALKEKFGVDKINIKSEYSLLYNSLFLAINILIWLLTIIYWCLSKFYFEESTLPNPPKIEFIIYENKSKNINSKESYKISIDNNVKNIILNKNDIL